MWQAIIKLGMVVIIYGGQSKEELINNELIKLYKTAEATIIFEKVKFCGLNFNSIIIDEAKEVKE